MTHARNDPGFTLVELLIVVAVISILAAIALPAMSRARAAALEGAAIGVVRAINDGQASYAASCASGYFAPSLIWLTRPPTNSQVPFISQDVNRNTIDLGGYRFRFRRGNRGASPAACNRLRAGRAVETYYFGADARLNDLTRFFGTNQGGVIYQSFRRIRITQQGAPPPPAIPLQ